MSKAEALAEIDEKHCVELGLSGYCFIAAKALRDLYPEAELWRLTDGHDHYRHVYLKVGLSGVDIAGFRNYPQMMLDLDDFDLIVEKSNWDKAEAYFNTVYATGGGDLTDEDKEVLAYAFAKFSKYIKDNAKTFMR